MNTSRSTLCSEHRLARHIACARLALAWIASVLFAMEGARVRRRLVRRRYGLLDLNVMARWVRNLVIIRTRQLTEPPRRLRNALDYAPAGFARPMRTGALVRSGAGSWLRRRLKAEGGVAARISHLLAALSQIDALARRLGRRLRRGLTRLRPIVLTHAPREAVASLSAPAPCSADSS